MKRIRILISLCAVLLLTMGIVYAEDMTVVDNDQLAIKIRGFDEKLISYNMRVSLENKTDMPLMFTINNVQINGIDVPTLWALEVAPNTQSRSQVVWIDLEGDGVTGEIQQIGGTFRVYDANDWALPDVTDAEFVFYPQGEEHVTVVEETKGKPVVIDDDRYYISVEDYQNSSLLYCYGMSVNLENRTEDTAVFTVRDVSVNGLPCDPYWATELSAGTKKKDTIGWFADTFEENEITKVEEIQLTFVIIEGGVWNGETQFEQTVTLKP